MTYQTDETISLTKEADSNLPKEESSSHHKWLGAVTAALMLGGGTAVVASSLSSSSSSLSTTNLVGRTVSPGTTAVWCDNPSLKGHSEGSGQGARWYDSVYVTIDNHEDVKFDNGCKGWAWYANNDIDVCGSHGSGHCRPLEGDVCCDVSRVVGGPAGYDAKNYKKSARTNCAKIGFGMFDQYYLNKNKHPINHWYCSEYK